MSTDSPPVSHDVRSGDGSGRRKALVAVGVLAGVLAALVLAGWAVGAALEDRPGGLDAAVLEWFVENRSSALTTAARLVTQLGGTAVLVPLAVLVGVAVTVKGRSFRAATFLAVAFVGAEVIVRVVKEAAGRARPPAYLATGRFADPAFPSAHVMLAVTMLGAVAVVVAGAGDASARGSGDTARWRRATWPVAGIAMLVVALTRLYLGAHWLTDVIGGAVMAAAWLVAVTVVVRPTRPTRPSASRTGVTSERWGEPE